MFINRMDRRYTEIMIYSEQVQRAVTVAARAHAGQLRKGKDVPYVVHPFSVLLVASQVTDDDDTLAACLLHDVLEDVAPEIYSGQDMRRDFGDHVLEIVKTVSKDEQIPGWRPRNEAYLDSIRNTVLQEALVVCAADKIHNLSDTLADYEVVGDQLWERFHAGKDDQLWWYGAVLAVMRQRLPDSPLTAQLQELVAELKSIVNPKNEA